MPNSVIGANVRLPGIFMKVTLGAGARSAAAGGKKVLLYGNKTASGSAAVETPVQVLSTEDSEAFFGAGSELDMMCKAALARYPFINLWAIPITASGSAASGEFEFSGTATAAGSYKIWIGPRSWTLDVASGDAAADIASNLDALLDGITDLEVTAAASTGTVTVTAKNTGLRGNYIRIQSIGAVAGVTHTQVNTYLSSGSGEDNPQNALDAVAGTDFGYHVAPTQTAAELAKFRTHVGTAAEPLNGRRSRFIWACNDTLANAVTLATGLNAARGQGAWHYNAYETPAVLAASLAAELAEQYDVNPAANTAGMPVAGILPQFADADRPTGTELNNALNNGLTALQTVSGEVRVAMSVTNRSQDDSSNPDDAVIHTHYVEVADFIAQDIEINFGNQFSDAYLVPDIEGVMPEPNEVTPNTGKDFILTRLETYGPGGAGNRLLSVIDEDMVETEIDSEVGSKLNGVIPIQPVELFLQGSFDVRQI